MYFLKGNGMSVARIRSIDFDDEGIADSYEKEVQENGAKWIPEAELIILIRTTDTSAILLTTFSSEEEAEIVANRLADWSESYGASSWNNRYRDSFVLMGQVNAQHIAPQIRP